MKYFVFMLAAVGLACTKPLVGETYESKAEGIVWTISGVFYGPDATIACGNEVKTCIRLTRPETVGARYISGKSLRDGYWYIGEG
ncbi:MAG: hypothetical protein BMS9Abin05_1188 [Rhodothermia bacterium]|nr:MAG: hypothetical protein BMS9Abin05_1188 [Rhodothermia bacterium]